MPNHFQNGKSSALRPGEWRPLTLVRYRCARCDEIREGEPKDTTKPGLGIRCGACRSPYWWAPRGTLLRGRPAAS